MKKFFALTVALVVLGAGSAFAGVSGSSHDFNTWADGEICKPCHTPHNAYPVGTGGPLWAHTSSSQTFAVYTSSTIDGTTGAPTGISLACLSCHDGVTAMDEFIGAADTVYDQFMTTANGAALGTDLTNDHPVSISYVGSTGDSGLYDTPLNSLELPGGNVECSSCHDVHDTTTAEKMLVISNANSQLCLSCHNK